MSLKSRGAEDWESKWHEGGNEATDRVRRRLDSARDDASRPFRLDPYARVPGPPLSYSPPGSH